MVIIQFTTGRRYVYRDSDAELVYKHVLHIKEFGENMLEFELDNVHHIFPLTSIESIESEMEDTK